MKKNERKFSQELKYLLCEKKISQKFIFEIFSWFVTGLINESQGQCYCPNFPKLHFQTFELPKNSFTIRISILNRLMKALTLFTQYSLKFQILTHYSPLFSGLPFNATKNDERILN